MSGGSGRSVPRRLTPRHLQMGPPPLTSLRAGILIVVMPRLLNTLVALYLIVIGVIGVIGRLGASGLRLG